VKRIFIMKVLLEKERLIMSNQEISLHPSIEHKIDEILRLMESTIDDVIICFKILTYKILN